MVAGQIILDLTDLVDDLLALFDDLFDGSPFLLPLGGERHAEVMVPAVDVVNDPSEDDRPSPEDCLKPVERTPLSV